jgi:hypothetical protein
MAAPAPRRADVDVPPVDPHAVPRAFAKERAKRRAREDHQAEVERARVRFWGLVGALLFFAVILSLTIWDQIQALFGI